MIAKDVKKWVGQKVFLVLSNGFRFTGIIPDFKGDTFSFIDKFNKRVDISCGAIDIIYSSDKW